MAHRSAWSWQWAHSGSTLMPSDPVPTEGGAKGGRGDLDDGGLRTAPLQVMTSRDRTAGGQTAGGRVSARWAPPPAPGTLSPVHPFRSHSSFATPAAPGMAGLCYRRPPPVLRPPRPRTWPGNPFAPFRTLPYPSATLPASSGASIPVPPVQAAAPDFSSFSASSPQRRPAQPAARPGIGTV